MPQSLAQIYLHIVFSTKERETFLGDREFRGRVHKYLGGVIRGTGCSPIRVGGVEDHVHILCRLNRTVATADLVRDVKKESSKWIKEVASSSQHFQWQAGYGAFSVSPSHVDQLIQYIENQEDHHHKETYQSEFRRIMQKYGVEWDERYVWD